MYYSVVKCNQCIPYKYLYHLVLNLLVNISLMIVWGGCSYHVTTSKSIDCEHYTI